MTASKPQVAVYGADGTLLGTVPADAISELADPPGATGKPSQAAVDANAAKVAQRHAVEEVTKAVAGVTAAAGPILAGLPRRTAAELVPLRKAAGTLTGQWNQLLAVAGPSRADALRALVANAAMTAMVGGRIDGTRAVNIAKRAVCQVAVNGQVI